MKKAAFFFQVFIIFKFIDNQANYYENAGAEKKTRAVDRKIYPGIKKKNKIDPDYAQAKRSDESFQGA